MSSADRNYYCSMKFRFLKVDLIRNTMYTCDAATPRSIDRDWLEANPGQLFNTESIVNDRRLMLQNIRNLNCEQNCWPSEDKGSVSPRLFRNGDLKTHTDLYQSPEFFDLTINSDCNLSCSYGCKEFSSSWRRDIAKNGPYKITGLSDRYELTPMDQIIQQLSQSEVKSNRNYQLLLNELRIVAPSLKTLYVTGGEPLLDNNLIDTLVDIPFDSDINLNLFSGLGMSESRFNNLLDKMSILSNKYKNFQLKISAESANQFYEFNRYGNTWNDFVGKINLLRQRNIKFIFHCTISNLTLFGFYDFCTKFNDIDFTMDFVHQPHMLSPHVLDDESKKTIYNQLVALDGKNTSALLKSIESVPTELEKLNLKEFLLEFTNRRPDLTLDIFPKTFVNWLGLSHVV